MKENFDKYRVRAICWWLLLFLDPRYKMKLIEFCFLKIYPSLKAVLPIRVVCEALYELYSEYVANYASNSFAFVNSLSTASGSSGTTHGALMRKVRA